MAISQLSLTDFRNLRSTTLDFDSRINLISGDNGSGKTSLLEAIYVLCQAQSFRTHQTKQCINHNKKGFLLFGRFNDHKIGIGRNESKVEIHVNGEIVNRRSELVSRNPINIVNSDSFALIEGSPQKRRAFLNWCMFHVEPAYAENWRLFQHALRQRNRLLKSGRDIELLEYWNEHLVGPSEYISAMRKQYCQRLQEIIESDVDEILQDLPLAIQYQTGWSHKVSLIDALKASRESDIRAGFTRVGIHRDDISFNIDGKNVSEVCSRGQSKRVCLALLLSALKLVGEGSKKQIILLIDDLNSELDKKAQDSVYRRFLQMDLQLFISNIESTVPAALEGKEFKLFHVEHGTIKPRNFS